VLSTALLSLECDIYGIISSPIHSLVSIDRSLWTGFKCPALTLGVTSKLLESSLSSSVNRARLSMVLIILSSSSSDTSSITSGPHPNIADIRRLGFFDIDEDTSASGVDVHHDTLFPGAWGTSAPLIKLSTLAVLGPLLSMSMLAQGSIILPLCCGALSLADTAFA